MMMLRKPTTPLPQSVSECLVKRHTHYLRFYIYKQIFTLASLEDHFMTVWMLVSNQDIITDNNVLTHSVLLRSIRP